jgi:hypothetical protein
VPKQNEEANSYANARVSRDLTKSKRSHALRTKVLILRLNLFESDSKSFALSGRQAGISAFLFFFHLLVGFKWRAIPAGRSPNPQ